MNQHSSQKDGTEPNLLDAFIESPADFNAAGYARLLLTLMERAHTSTGGILRGSLTLRGQTFDMMPKSEYVRLAEQADIMNVAAAQVGLSDAAEKELLEIEERLRAAPWRYDGDGKVELVAFSPSLNDVLAFCQAHPQDPDKLDKAVELMMSGWERAVLMELADRVRHPYCDECRHLFPTEAEQDATAQGARREPHRCRRSKRVLNHLDQHPRIPRPADCPGRDPRQ